MESFEKISAKLTIVFSQNDVRFYFIILYHLKYFDDLVGSIERYSTRKNNDLHYRRIEIKGRTNNFNIHY